jgi:hypothetical protein
MPADVAAGPHAAFRDAFMTLSRWVPDYFETRTGFRPLRQDPNTIASTDEWTIAAWTDALTGMTGTIDRFSFVHVMLFHPAIEDERATAEAAARLGRLRAGLRLGYRRRRHVSVTYVPGPSTLLGAGAVDRDTRLWHFGSDSDPYRALTPTPLEDGTALARALQSSWLDRLTRNIWHD